VLPPHETEARSDARREKRRLAEGYRRLGVGEGEVGGVVHGGRGVTRGPWCSLVLTFCINSTRGRGGHESPRLIRALGKGLEKDFFVWVVRCFIDATLENRVGFIRKTRCEKPGVRAKCILDS